MEPSWTDPSKVSVVLTRATGDAPAQTHSPQPQTARAIVSSFPARRFDGPFACLLTLCGTWFDGPRRQRLDGSCLTATQVESSLAGFNSLSPYWPRVTHWWLFSMPPYPS